MARAKRHYIPGYVWHICLATAHAAKFPDVIRQALSVDGKLPEQAVHKSIEAVKDLYRHVRLCDCTNLDRLFVVIYSTFWDHPNKKFNFTQNHP